MQDAARAAPAGRAVPLVGIIALIKEIVVVAGAERPKESGFAEFLGMYVEIGVLSGVVLEAGDRSALLRMREEKPAESNT